MGRLIYSMLVSLDGYVADADGRFGWAMPDGEILRYVTERAASVGTYLYGRCMYETMLYWETEPTASDADPGDAAWARQWRAADKVVYSTTLSEPRSARTRFERTFDPAAVRTLKAEADGDLTVDGPGLAVHALQAGLVDEVEAIVFPVLVGGGTRFFPDGVRLELVDRCASASRPKLRASRPGPRHPGVSRTPAPRARRAAVSPCSSIDEASSTGRTAWSTARRRYTAAGGQRQLDSGFALHYDVRHRFAAARAARRSSPARATP